jgi:hypothetical protein
MPNINRTLRDSDPALLPILAERWQVNIRGQSTTEAIESLSEFMLEAERAEHVWGTLDDAQRGALQMLIASGGKMPTAKFERLFGEIRLMGAARIVREKPHENPISTAEALFYRGLIAQTFEQADAGPRPMIYVPDDLLGVLPTHKTGYQNLDSEPGEAEGLETLDEAEIQRIQAADTTIVDDLTTLLAYLQLYGAVVESDTLGPGARAEIMPYLLTSGDSRLTFIFGLALDAELVEIAAGKAVPKRSETRRWLAFSRAEQVRRLAEGWREGANYRDLWHVPGLHPEPGGELDDYDPAVARQAATGFMADILPKQGWWSLQAFIEAVKDIDPDFQRPGGDYESWYIRNDDGDYLQGFESWDAVEGALLEFYTQGPMFWLGLIDRAEDAARLTAYGRAFLGDSPWPTPADPADKILVESDGTLKVSRKIERLDRFQIARFTTWGAAGDPYTYKLDARGIEQARTQGIHIEHINSFMERILGTTAMPPAVRQLLENWRTGPTATVSLERLIVLRTSAPETLDYILETPALRRYLGARLGPMAAIVRADQWEALRDALGEQGMTVELEE